MNRYRHPIRYFLQAALEHPERIAVQSDDLAFSYRRLDRLSSAIATRIRRFTGNAPGHRVCILMPKNAYYIAAILGIWKAGCAYVPLETTLPDERRNRIIDNCEPSVVLSDGTAVGLATPIIPLSREHEADMLANGVDDPTILEAAPEDLAYLIYTSGTTGTPKGVMIANSALTTLIEWCNRVFGDLREQTNILNVANFSFDQSVLDIALFLAQGKTLHVLDDPKNILTIPYLIHTHRIHILSTVPHILSVLATTPKLLHRFDLGSLQTIFGGGAVFSPHIVMALRELLGVGPRIFNIYGPTEATVYCFLHRVDDRPIDIDRPLPIGVPFDTTQALILDPISAQPVPPGELGILALRGPQVMQGYWRMPKETAAALIPDPEDSEQRVYLTGDYARMDEAGIYHFTGRKDETIKSAGYRIDLNDINHNLLRLPCVADAAVVALADPLLENRIKAFVQLREGYDDTAEAIIDRLKTLLPHYMMPHGITFLGALPKSPAGKTDCNTLKRLYPE
ncbi:MAG: amino acid adenylation domain-containing protein [Magnetococcales bacterium]|nr:amino acid adenylation domain-containing protein [Magnetococcales bacterium]